MNSQKPRAIPRRRTTAAALAPAAAALARASARGEAPAAETLAVAFETFARASSSLESAHETLRRRVEDLTIHLQETEAKLRRSLEENLRLHEIASRTSRLEAMGRMAAEIAHEIRNPLGSLELTASLLRDDLQQDPPKHELALSVLEGIRALTRVTGNLLTFTRSVSPKCRQLDAAELLARTQDLIAAACKGRGIALGIECGAGLSLAVDPELTQQILLNLVQNALEATPEGGTVTIRAAAGVARDAGGLGRTHVPAGRSEAARPPAGAGGVAGRAAAAGVAAEAGPVAAFAADGAPARAGLPSGSGGTGREVELSVTDTGHGMDPATLARVFDPFFTTKEGGTGLGLSISHRLALAQGARLDLRSAPGAGSTATLTIPAAGAGLAPAPHAGDPHGPRRAPRGLAQAGDRCEHEAEVGGAPDQQVAAGEALSGAVPATVIAAPSRARKDRP